MAVIQYSARYIIELSDTRQNEAVQALNKTFAKPGVTLSIKRSTFPIGKLYLLIGINKTMTIVSAVFTCKPPSYDEDRVRLATWHDIETIPLMHPAVWASKNP